jgi:hypothetical protein
MTTLLAGLVAMMMAHAGAADPLRCDLSGYKGAPGLNASVASDVLSLTWDGAAGEELRLGLTIEGGVPTFREIAVRKQGGAWAVVVANAKPEFRVVSGIRRVTSQQLQPLRALGIEITPEVVDAHKWDAFWDAPLDLRAPSGGQGFGGSVPPADGVAGQPGLPRSPSEIRRATGSYHATTCAVKTNGARLEVSFPGMDLGVFSGALQVTVYRGTSLVRMEAVASTREQSVAYKYDAGLTGLPISDRAGLIWKDLAGTRQSYRFGGAPNADPVTLRTSNRLVVAETGAGSIAAFPPPHTFFWAREVMTNLGYSWYRKDGPTTFSFGVRQAEIEEEPQYIPNFPLYNARPGTTQRMPVYFLVTGADASAALASALSFTNEDRYRALPGYQVMASHFHTDVGPTVARSTSMDTRLADIDAMKAAGINVFGPVDSPKPLDIQAAAFEAARRSVDRDFIMMPEVEIFSNLLGGHADVLFAHPVFWTEGRTADQPLVETDPKYGKVYRVGKAADFMEMIERENGVVFMPHPRTKGSAGYPDAIKDTDHFRNARYGGIGWRWGMGLDLSEQRLSELRALPLLDDMNNWVADDPAPKYLWAINEANEMSTGPGRSVPLPVDLYGMGPVNYIRMAALPTSDDWSPIVDAVRRGDFFVTTGEVLIPSFSLEGTGARRTLVAEVEWTFPMEFVEVVWGDGKTTDRQIIPVTDLPPFGRKRFEIPFDVAGKKWIRFAAWDAAGNGALVQPVRISP